MYDMTSRGLVMGTATCCGFVTVDLGIARTFTACSYPWCVLKIFRLASKSASRCLLNRGVAKIGGYHCWAFFHTEDRGWVPVDVSEPDKHPEMKDYYFGSLTEDRVTFRSAATSIWCPRRRNPK
jgi:hypothetical protein